ncbi:MAG TPA: hypothetical protein VKX96_01080 [Chloroflexota bacterium]|nr:hypothetical protein [Chloroflexota bacterium]
MNLKTRSSFLPASWPVLVAGGLVTVAAVVVVTQFTANDRPLSQLGQEAQSFVVELPDRIQRFVREARERFALAKEGFRAARAESERGLIAQLEEAKQRGSLPPV